MSKVWDINGVHVTQYPSTSLSKTVQELSFTTRFTLGIVNQMSLLQPKLKRQSQQPHLDGRLVRDPGFMAGHLDGVSGLMWPDVGSITADGAASTHPTYGTGPTSEGLHNTSMTSTILAMASNLVCQKLSASQKPRPGEAHSLALVLRGPCVPDTGSPD